MQNDIRYIYDEMCDRCKISFKKIILAIRNDRTKDVNNLALFFCEVNPNTESQDDHGVMPIALINCTNNKYAFFWKTNLLDHNGNPKIPIIDHTVELSQETINKIPLRRRPSTTSLPDDKPTGAKEEPVNVSAPIAPPFIPLEQQNNGSDNVSEQSFSAEIEASNEDNENNNEKDRNDLVVAAEPAGGETVSLVKQMQKNQMMTMRKMVQVINHKFQWKIWTLIVVLVLSLTGFGIGGWQLYRHLNNERTTGGGGNIGDRVNITLLGGDLSRQVITIDNRNNFGDLYNALLSLEVGSKNDGKLEPQLLEAIKDPNTVITFNSDRFQEDQTAYAATIIINADKASKFYGITNIAVQAKSKRIDINRLSKNLTGTEVTITSDNSREILRAVLGNATITGQLSAAQKKLLEDARDLKNRLLLRIDGSVSQGGPATNIDLIVTSNGSDLYKNTAIFNLTVKWP
ncbi:hypothetical protein S100390_v1c06050 [Spiroplasma sp. NBRC 100390]|uniref:hypothetical protein n=1 Tax=unclassified Spiroplasma TaxID=2637901 RepID=UPI0008927C79|nr:MULTISPECIES: hypothetical protein [unclassified Spiroplasma]AOX43942.1 hypothetical protein STU14_v1c06050 [Spiroplasma sp. TU-14]APE13412.1 hypothetical protein S100390_v1c06050 [Spiroplasma sp. NBRC 100390]